MDPTKFVNGCMLIVCLSLITEFILFQRRMLIQTQPKYETNININYFYSKMDLQHPHINNYGRKMCLM